MLVTIIEQANSIPILANEESLIQDANTIAERKKIKYDYLNISSHAELMELQQGCVTALQQIALEKQLQILDVGKEIKSLKYFSDHVHMTPEGSRITAHYYARFFEQLLEQNKISPKASK